MSAAPGAAADAPRVARATVVASEAAAATVDALAADDATAAAAALPADFAAVMNYMPVVEPGSTTERVLADPGGDCSSPVPLPRVFESPCRVHDFGYDVLRYARDTGGELGPDARRELDALLGRHLRAACETDAAADIPTCVAAAHIASTAVQINSWRQGYRLPVSEPLLPLLVLAGLAVGPAAWATTFLRKAFR